MQIVETEDTFELVWHIPLNGSASKISKTDRYLKNGEVVEAARRDGRPGLLRSQLTFTPEGHVHIRYVAFGISLGCWVSVSVVCVGRGGRRSTSLGQHHPRACCAHNSSSRRRATSTLGARQTEALK